MKMCNVKTGEIAPSHQLGSTKSGKKLYLNPGPGWVPCDYKGRVRQDRDGNYVLSSKVSEGK